ncbi:hypothetical protein HX862_08130 [Pseudomonas sp. D5002]|uniref:hypothetical protein n=1 Tax=Pseudomonas sp. D5002 TaxID=2738818 RepID=UPI0015A01727|nr:hypothetical protein [Pseudomonas sp. D5002]NWB07857.1 hypothetical protein [Pseudomonas sp. D5002]
MNDEVPDHFATKIHQKGQAWVGIPRISRPCRHFDGVQILPDNSGRLRFLAEVVLALHIEMNLMDVEHTVFGAAVLD